MRLIYVMAAVAATASVPLLAAPEPGDSRAKMVCKYAKVTGSRLGRERVCLRKSDWDLVDEETRKSVDKATIPAAPLPE